MKNFKLTVKYFLIICVSLVCGLGYVSCGDDNDEPKIEIVNPDDEEALDPTIVSGYYGHWISSDKKTVYSINQNGTLTKYSVNAKDKSCYDSKKTGRWEYSKFLEALKFYLDNSTLFYRVTKLTANTLTITKDNDKENEILLVRITENQVPSKESEPSKDDKNLAKKLIGNWYSSDCEIGIFSNGEMYLKSPFRDGVQLVVRNYRIKGNVMQASDLNKNDFEYEYEIVFEDGGDVLKLNRDGKTRYNLRNVNHNDKASFDYHGSPFVNYMQVGNCFFEITKFVSQIYHARDYYDKNSKELMFYGVNQDLDNTYFRIVQTTPSYEGVTDWTTGTYTITSQNALYYYLGYGKYGRIGFNADGTLKIRRNGNVTTYDFNGKADDYNKLVLHVAVTK